MVIHVENHPSDLEFERAGVEFLGVCYFWSNTTGPDKPGRPESKPTRLDKIIKRLQALIREGSCCCSEQLLSLTVRLPVRRFVARSFVRPAVRSTGSTGLRLSLPPAILVLRPAIDCLRPARFGLVLRLYYVGHSSLPPALSETPSGVRPSSLPASGHLLEI